MLLAIVAVAFGQNGVQRGPTTDFVFRVLWLLIFGAVVWYRWQTPCQHCGKALGLFGLMWRPAAGFLSSPSCPNCGTSVDRDVPAP
jgi:hypothetical protein